MAHDNLYRSPPLLGITEATETTNEHDIFAHLQTKIDPKDTKHASVASLLGCFWISGPNSNTISHTTPAATLHRREQDEIRAYQKAIDFSKRRDQKLDEDFRAVEDESIDWLIDEGQGPLYMLQVNPPVADGKFTSDLKTCAILHWLQFTYNPMSTRVSTPEVLVVWLLVNVLRHLLSSYPTTCWLTEAHPVNVPNHLLTYMLTKCSAQAVSLNAQTESHHA